MGIATGLFALLSIAAIGADRLIKVIKKRQLTDIIMLGGFGLLALGYVFFMFGRRGFVIAACISWIIGWPGLAVGTYWPKIGPLFIGKQKAAPTAQPAAAEPAPAKEAPAEEKPKAE